MDQIILRPCSAVVSDPRNGTINTFQGIREKIIKKRYSIFREWREDVTKVLQIARSNEDPLVNDICAELDAQFQKHYALLSQLSELQFSDALTKIAGELAQIAEQTDPE
jgi:hypothetical protein